MLEVGFKLNLHIFYEMTDPTSMKSEKEGGKG